ncbi:MAG: class I SAM-dependent methyltransferase [Gemmatimonadaceae bacterium]
MELSPPPIASPAAALYAAFDTDPTPIVDFLAWLVTSQLDRVAAPRVLDVGCGLGRLLPPLAARGWQVLGLEPDVEYAAHAAARLREVVGAEVRVGGFTDIQARTGDVTPADLVVGINGSFAYLTTPAARADALGQCRQALRAGGLLVLDLPNLLRILYEYRGPAMDARELDGRMIRLERRHRLDYDNALFITDERYEVREASGIMWELRREHPYAVITWPELSAALRAADFSHLRTFTSFVARVPERLGPGRMLVVAQAS